LSKTIGGTSNEPLSTAQRLMLFFACRSALAAAVRLGIIGPYRAQWMQQECAAELETVRKHTQKLDVDSLAQTAPLIGLLQSTHDRLYSRLFQS
jgi:urease accessory protein